MHRTDPSGRARRSKTLATITRLLARCDILCLQETRLGTNDNISLKTQYNDKYIIYYENDILGHGGTLTMVSRKFARDYQIEQVHLGEAAKGRILPLTFTPKSNLTPTPPSTLLPSLCVVNVYLTSGASPTERHLEFEELGKLDPTTRIILCGDFNFVEVPSDAPSSTSNIIITNETYDKWCDLVEKLNLKEVYQPTHTCYSLTKSLHSNHTSRIDRFYINHTESELSLLHPTSFIPYLGFCSVDRPGSPEATEGLEPSGPRMNRTMKSFISDHVPICLYFHPTSPQGSRGKKLSIPQWYGDIPGVARDIEARWDSLGKDPDPYQAIINFNKAVYQSFKNFKSSQDSKKKIFGGDLGEIAIGTSILRVTKADNIDIPHLSALLRKAPTLDPLVVRHPDGTVDTTALELRLNALIDNTATVTNADTIKVHTYHDYIPTKHNQNDPITRARAALPSTRKRITHLRACITHDTTDDPEEMGDIIVNHYQQVWKKNHTLPPYKDMCDFVASRLKVVPTHLQPEMVTPDLVAETIHATNNSSPGPDGIPFSILRTYLKHDFCIAENIAAIIASMGIGTLPPAGFNYGRFLILPKNDTCTIGDTRGLSVANSVNRITASCMVKVLTPAFSYLIGDWQKGFIGGRVGTDHVHGLTGNFYQKLTKKQQQYILLIDIKRAFDTLSHNFIHAVLETIGLAPWARLVVKALLHVVRVFPVLAIATNHAIRIRRGVKQGCPLSPLLFVLCFECLLAGLAKLHRLRPYAFADDLALATRSVTYLLLALEHMKRFATFSDLHLNPKKTQIASTLPPSHGTRQRFIEAGWGTIEFVERAVYLGVLFGRGLTTKEVGKTAFAKFKERAIRFRTALARMSLHMRIIVFNVFILPTLYYLAQFIVLHYGSVIVPAKEICRRYITPFGSGFAYCHLITPKGLGLGPHTPLRDLWSHNFALLGTSFPMEPSHDQPYPQLGEWEWVNQYQALDKTLDPAAHRAYAAWVFLYDWARRAWERGAVLDLSDLPPPHKPDKRRNWLYRQLVLFAYDTPRSDPGQATSVATRLGKFLGQAPNTDFARRIKGHLSLLGKSMTPAKWNLQLRLSFRCLPFEHRRSQARMAVVARPTPGVSSPYPCYMCGKGSDSAAHAYTQCRVVVKARAEFSAKVGCALPSTLQHVLLAYNPISKCPLITQATITFNYAVWHFRTHFCCTLARPPPFNRGARRLCNLALTAMPTEIAKDPEGERALALALNPPEDAIIGFVDGSAYGSPGPTGAGIFLSGPHLPDEDYAVPLGTGDNNDGEMQAIRLLLCRLLVIAKRYDEDQRPPVIIFSDSCGCLGYLLNGWKAGVPMALARATSKLLREAKKLFKITLVWVRGHTKIPGNERADVNAKAGAKAARNITRAASSTAIKIKSFNAYT
jgi:ribonuclease HI/exonuclease III